MKLPELPIKIPKRNYQIYKLQGLDRSDDFGEGSLWDTLNISSKRLPYFTTSKDESDYGLYDNVTDITAWESLLFINNGSLFYNDIEIADDMLGGDKQFAVLNTKIVIFPDKKYLDLNPTLEAPTLVDMVNAINLPEPEETISVTTAPTTSDTEQTMTITGGADYESDFNKYDKDDYIHVVLTKEISGEPVTYETKEYNIYFVKAETSSTDLVVTFRKDDDNTFEEDTYSQLKTERHIPDFDYICSKDNRLWGCVSKTQTIWASELGIPTKFDSFSDTDYSSWATNVATPDAFTGCAALGSSLVFFKEFCMHKILGNAPSEYSLYDYDVDGVQNGSSKSIQVINDTVFYLSNRGVMMYSGGNPQKISEQLGSYKLSGGVGGTDGERYYLSCSENIKGENRTSLLTYDLRTGVWLREDSQNVTGFARLKGTLYAIKGGKIKFDNGLPLTTEWYIQFNDMFESTYNNYGRRTGSVLQKKMYSKLVMRAEMPEESYAVVKVRTDGGLWEDVSHIVGRSGVFNVAIPINRCDKFGIRIEGKGEFTLLAMEREYIGESTRDE